MKTTVRTSIILLAAAFGYSAQAQELHKEITVEQEIVPSKRDASRIGVLPTVALPPVGAPNLQYSSRAVTANVPGEISVLEPVAWTDPSFATDSLHRGYLQAGFFPLCNSTLSAGYRILSLPNTHLKAWCEYDGALFRREKEVRDYNQPNVDYSKLPQQRGLLRDHTATAGAAFGHSFSRTSKFELLADYTFGYHNYEWATAHASTQRVGSTARFCGAATAFNYRAEASYRFFGFGDVGSYFNANAAVRQQSATAKGEVDMEFDEQGRLEIDLDATTLSSSRSLRRSIAELADSKNLGLRDASTAVLVTFNPAYIINKPTWDMRIGANLDVVANSGKVLRISPDVTAAWTPWQTLGFEVKAHGGSTLNPLADLYDISPYMRPDYTYGSSDIPYALDGKITVGPFKGAYIQLLASYAYAKDWLMPVEYNGGETGATYGAIDRLKGGTIGAATGYSYRKIVTFNARYERALSDGEKDAYCLWRDRARDVVNASLEVKPLSKLTLSLGYEFRGNRKVYDYSVVSSTPSAQYEVERFISMPRTLGCISNLSAGADYQIIPDLNVWVRGENLLNRQYTHIGFREAQGITALIGASWRF